MRNVGLQVQRNQGGIVNNQDYIIFNDVIDNESQNISYNPITGVVKILQPGSYFFNWWIGVVIGKSVASFTLVSVDGDYVISNAPEVMGAVVGSTLVTVTAPTSIAIKNISGRIVEYTSSNIRANLTILDMNAIQGDKGPTGEQGPPGEPGISDNRIVVAGRTSPIVMGIDKISKTTIPFEKVIYSKLLSGNVIPYTINCNTTIPSISFEGGELILSNFSEGYYELIYNINYALPKNNLLNFNLSLRDLINVEKVNYDLETSDTNTILSGSINFYIKETEVEDNYKLKLTCQSLTGSTAVHIKRVDITIHS